MNLRLPTGNNGFTITELLIVIIATGVISGAIFSFTFNYWRSSYAQQSSVDSLNSRLNAGDILRELIASSTGLINQNSIPDNNVLVPDPGNGLFWEELRATTETRAASPGTITPILYFKRFSFDSDRDIIFDNLIAYEDEYVLYMNGDDNILYLRSIANTDAPGNRLKTSCPPESATESCPADRVVAEDVSALDVRYFSRTGNVVDYTSVTDPDTGEFIGPDFSAAEVAELIIHISRTPPFQQTATTQVSTTIRVALRN
jgi:prepilin-type N-terminal cleavage/methylation domain-containing protein